MAESLVLSSVELASHCIVNLTIGTNYSLAVPRYEVQTSFSLRFDGAYPLKIKGLKQGADFVGFELSLIGPDECEQLIKALEAAATALRHQSGLVAEVPGEAVAPAPLPLAFVGGTLAEVASYHEDWYTAEVGITRLLAVFGQQRLPSGEAVGSYVLSQVGSHEPASETTRALWTLYHALSQSGLPSLEQLQAHAQEPNEHALLAELAAEPGLDAYHWVGFARTEDRLQLLCDATLTRFFRSVNQSDRLAMLQQLAEEPLDEPQRHFLGARHHEAAKLESQMAKLLNFTIG